VEADYSGSTEGFVFELAVIYIDSKVFKPYICSTKNNVMKKILFIAVLLAIGSAQAQTHSDTTVKEYVKWHHSDSVVVGRRYYITKDLYKDVYFIPTHPGYKKYNKLPKKWAWDEPIKEPRWEAVTEGYERRSPKKRQ
jgi:hypothetical protein